MESFDPSLLENLKAKGAFFKNNSHSPLCG